MIIKSIEDAKLLQSKLSYKKQHIVYVFYKNDICLYVGETNGKSQFSYIMNHHTVKRIKSKFKDGYYIKIYFEKDIPYYHYTQYEGMLIGLLNPKLNKRRIEDGRILTGYRRKYNISYLDYYKRKRKYRIDYHYSLDPIDVFRFYVQYKYPNIYNDVFVNNQTTKYQILKICRFKNIHDAYYLIKPYSKKKDWKYVFKSILNELKKKDYLNIDVYNYIKQGGCNNYGYINKDYL